MANFGSGPISPEEVKKRGYQEQKDGGLTEVPGVLGRSEIPGRAEISRQLGSDSQAGKVLESEELETVAKVREALKTAGVADIRSDEQLRSLTADERGAILSGDEAALKKLGLKKLTTNEGSTARALTDMLNSLEQGK